MHYRGVIHMHSTHSYDGKVSLPELKQLLQQHGVSFCCMTEHTDELDVEQAAAFVDECAALSDEQFLFIPGFEVPYGNAHVLHIGTADFVCAKANAAQLREWRTAAPLVILAHPVRNNFKLDATLTGVIDGVEVWNQQYEGKRAPRPRSLRLLESLQQQRVGLIATGGLDFHRREHFGSPIVTLAAAALTTEAIVAVLKRGAFSFGNEEVTVDGTGRVVVGRGLALRLKSAGSILTIISGKFVNKQLAAAGLSLPKGLRRAIRAKV